MIARAIAFSLLAAGCAARLSTFEHPAPFHQAVGCWRITAVDSNPGLQRRLLPGPVVVRMTPEAVDFFDASDRTRPTLGHANFRLDLLAGLKGRFLTSWIPVTRDTVSLDWSLPGPSGLTITAEVRGDSLHGYGKHLTDAGPGYGWIRIAGARVRC
jgi:hypothetical protein